MRRFEEYLTEQKIKPASVRVADLGETSLVEFQSWLVRSYGRDDRATISTYVAGVRAFFRFLSQRHLLGPDVSFEAIREHARQAMGRVAYRTPRVLDQKIQLRDYEGPIRQLTITDLGHEEPTLLLTNQLRRSAAHLVGRYAQRMIIENHIADGIDFFHMDALSSAVAMKVNCDLQLTLMASSLYRILGVTIGRGYERAKSRHIFRDFVDATATVDIDEKHINVQFQKRAHNPLLLAAGYGKTDVAIPWLGNKRLAFTLG